jgi:hypothetical protein
MKYIKCEKCGEESNIRLWMETKEMQELIPDTEHKNWQIKDIDSDTLSLEVECLSCRTLWTADTLDDSDLKLKEWSNNGES